MSFTADLEAARLTVLLDLRHPLAYLALAPARDLGRELGIAINWLPLATPTLRPPTLSASDEDRGTRHRRHRAQAIAREIEIYARQQDLLLSGYYRSGDAEAATRGWLWIRDRNPAQLDGD